MWFYRGDSRNWARCRNCRECGPLQVVGYRRIRCSWDQIQVMWDVGYPGPCELDDVRIPVPAHLRPACRAWASGVMPCNVFADWLEEHLPDRIPQPVLDLLREPCKNPEPVEVASE